MDLTTYLERHGETISAFARRTGTTRQAMWRYVKGKRLPPAPVLLRIEQATEGQVTTSDLARQFVAVQEAA
jgi:transcriptional regulator with XRE-family HTH domain